MKRKEENEDQGGPSMERWLLTYSDMITLLLAFFIIMYVMSTVNQAKFQALANSLNITFEGGQGIFDSQGPSMIEGQTAGVSAVSEAERLAQVQKELNAYLEQQGLSNTVNVSKEDRGLVISFQEMILFPKGEATLTPEAHKIISKVGGILKGLPNYIRVEGHTCDLPISNGSFRSNWELSSARAINVVHEFISSSGMEPGKLSATAYSEYRPRVKNDSEKNRILNRRVDIVVLSSKYEDIEPGVGAAAPQQKNSGTQKEESSSSGSNKNTAEVKKTSGQNKSVKSAAEKKTQQNTKTQQPKTKGDRSYIP